MWNWQTRPVSETTRVNLGVIETGDARREVSNPPSGTS